MRGDQLQAVELVDGKAMLSNREIKEHLLCGDCEQKFGRVETVVSPLLAKDPQRPVPWLDEIVPSANAPDAMGMSTSTRNAALARFTAMVIWRAHVSSLPNDLGPYGPSVAAYLFDESAPFPEDVYVMLSVVTGEEQGVNLRTPMTLPASARTTYGWQHWFLCGGVQFRLIVGGEQPPNVNELCFVRSGGRVFLGAQKQLLRQVNPLARNKPVGKFARTRLK